MKNRSHKREPRNPGDSERVARLFKIGTVIAPTI